jgi:hypothetical protein
MGEQPERDDLERELASSRDLVHELESELAALRPLAAELRRELTAIRTGLGQTAELPADEWQGANGSRPEPPFAGIAPPPPLPRPVLMPRLVLETAFLAAAAAVAALADLDALWIAAVMAGAWLLVALSEWAAFAKQRRWRLDDVAPPLPEAGSPAWYVPPVEQTVLRGPDAAESHTVVTALPAEETGVQPAVSLEDTVAPPRRRRFWRRRGEDAAGADGDPWEA